MHKFAARPLHLIIALLSVMIVPTRNVTASDSTQVVCDTSFEFEAGRLPDPCAVVVFIDTDGFDTEVFAMNSDGDHVVNLTNNTAFEIGAVISPNGDKIAYFSNIDGDYKIYTMNSDGTGISQNAVSTIGGLHLSWSPSGDRLLFTGRGTDSPDLFRVNADGTNLANITNSSARENFPKWSPNSEVVTFVSDQTGTQEIYTMYADGSNAHRLTEFEDINASLIAPAWSPDGSQIAFTKNNELYLINSDGSNLSLISQEGDNIAAMWFDSQTLVYVKPGYSWVAVNSDGTNRRFVKLNWPENTTFSYPVNWQPPTLTLFQLPIADAGQDQIITASIDGTAAVMLDGSGSLEGDGGPIMYSWSEGTTELISTTAPTSQIVLSVGTHNLTLEVRNVLWLTDQDEVQVIIQAPTPQGR